MMREQANLWIYINGHTRPAKDHKFRLGHIPNKEDLVSIKRGLLMRICLPYGKQCQDV